MKSTVLTMYLEKISWNQNFILNINISRAILEVIVSGVACTPIEVEKYASCTLLSVSMSSNVSDSSQITDSAINSCIKFLEDQEFIRLQHLDSGVRYMVC